MAKLKVPPTKSSLLALKRQLAFAQEGYDLLDQKRQILVFELMSRLQRAQETERRVDDVLRRAHAALREAMLDLGSLGLDRASLTVPMGHRVEVTSQSMMGLKIPRVSTHMERMGVPFSLVGTSASTDLAARHFAEALPLLAELAELQNAVIRLATELRKTQRRCNALSKIFIPSHQETIAYIAGSLEERDREFATLLKRIRPVRG